MRRHNQRRCDVNMHRRWYDVVLTSFTYLYAVVILAIPDVYLNIYRMKKCQFSQICAFKIKPLLYYGLSRTPYKTEDRKYSEIWGKSSQVQWPLTKENGPMSNANYLTGRSLSPPDYRLYRNVEINLNNSIVSLPYTYRYGRPWSVQPKPQTVRRAVPLCVGLIWIFGASPW